MSLFDVAIIGGGLAGCSAAYHTALRRASVVLFERGRCGAQASGVNFGGVRQQGRHRAELPISRRSRAIWQRLAELVGSDCEFRQSGHLKLAYDEADLASLEAYRDMAAEYELPLEILSRDQLAVRYPYIGKDFAGGSLSPTDGQANPRLVAPAFARAAKKAGADIREMCAVQHAFHDGRDFVIACESGTVRARRLINVAGAWGAQVAGMFGEHVPEEVMAPNMCVTEPLPLFIGPNLGVCGGAIYIRQIPHGSVIFGAGLGIADRDLMRARPLAEVTTEAAREAIQLVPRLKEALLARTWTGIEGRMPDGIPVLGPSGTTQGLFHAFGFSGHGFQLGPAVGAILTELCLDGESSTPIEDLSISRFQVGGHT